MAEKVCPTCGHKYIIPRWVSSAAECPKCAGHLSNQPESSDPASQTCNVCGHQFHVPQWMAATAKCPQCEGNLKPAATPPEPAQATPPKPEEPIHIPGIEQHLNESDGSWEFNDVNSNQGHETGRDRSYLLVPLVDFVEKANFNSQEQEEISKAMKHTWWDEGWDTVFKQTVGRELGQFGFCDDPGELTGFVLDMGNGPSFGYRLFKVHESFLSLDRKVGDLPQYEGNWFIMIYDKEEGTTAYRKLCQLLQVSDIERYNWSVWE